MGQPIFSDEHINAIAARNESAFNDVLGFIQQILRYELRKKRLSLVDAEDIRLTALVEVLTSVQNGECNSGLDLERTVKRAVWRVAQRHRRNLDRQLMHEVGGIEELLLADNSPSIDDQLIAEESVALRLESPKESAKLLYKDQKVSEAESVSKADLLVVDDALIHYFKNHPDEMYKLNPRRFEELVAAILKDLGYSVELTAQSADGGVDIFATQKSGVGEVLLIVDCKRYAPANHVGVEIVRALYGIGEQLRATMAMIATTSFFTKPAQAFQRTVSHRLSLKDYNDLNSWLVNYGYGNRK